MVWRKKKQQSAAPSGGDHGLAGDASHREVTRATEQGPSVGSKDSSSLATTSLTARNIDFTWSEWEVHQEEFSVPAPRRIGQRPYVIPRNYRISGAVSSERQVLVCGEFADGVLDAPTVTVAPSGVVRGRVLASSVQVAGTVDASVVALVSVEVSGRGRVAGEVKAPAMKVWPGARLQASIMTSR